MRILIKNCNLISMSDNRPKIEEGTDILIEKNRIAKIEKNISEDGIEKIINAAGKVVMPGLINTHSHIPMSIFRETVDGYKTQDWLEKEIWPREDNLKAEDIYYASKLSCYEMIRTGTTTINDMYFYTDYIIKAALDTGVRLQTTRALLGKDNDDGGRLEELKRLVDTYNEDTISFNVGIHGMYTCDREYIRECIRYAQSKNLPVQMHLCENQEERNTIISLYGITDPGQVIAEEFKNTHNILAHSVKLTDKDLDYIKETNSYIAHCPISNLKLGCGIAPISDMINKGICISLGTDGQGSGTNLDMFEVMKFAALLQKGVKENPELMPAYEVIKMATINGAKALRLDKEIGSIEEGKIADIIMLDMDELVMSPKNDIFSEIVYNAKGSNVDTTIINGKVLMENKIIISSSDEKETVSKCEGIFERL